MVVLDDVLGPGRPARIDLFVPDSVPTDAALRRTTVLGVGAHPDDLELGGVWGVVTCAGRADRWFTGVTCTDGSGSALNAGTGAIDVAELVARRREEQRGAARVGRYGLQVQLGHPSAQVRDPRARAVLVEELAVLIDAARPGVIVGHDLLDRHTTHAAVGLATVEACRSLRPRPVPSACSGWRAGGRSTGFRPPTVSAST